MAIQKVVIVGGSGTAGTAILDCLIASPLQPTIITRASSRSTFPAGVPVIQVGDDYPLEELVAAFTGQDAVVCSLNVLASAVQTRIIDAAAQAGVKRFIPSEFGLNSKSAKTMQRIPALAGKEGIIAHLVAKEAEGLSWTGIATGAFFDWGLKTGWLRVDLTARTAKIVNDGTARFAASTLRGVGDAVVAVLLHEEETKNKYIYVQSFATTQLEVIESLERQTGQKWTVESIDEEAFIRENALRGDSGDMERIENVVFVQAIVDSNFETAGLANKAIGLKEKNLDAEIKKILEATE